MDLPLMPRLGRSQTCEEFERIVREMLVATTPTPEEEVPSEEEEKQAAQGAQEDEQET